MDKLMDFLPFIIPLAIAEFALLTHKNYKRGNRTLWLVVALVGMQFIGPVLYFLLGKESD